MSVTASSLLARDRDKGFPEGGSALLEEWVRIEHALFPSMKHGGNRPLCQIRLTSAGLVVLGFLELDEAQIRSEEAQAGLSLAGGIAGAIGSERHASAARSLRAGAFDGYRAVAERLSSRDAKSAAGAAPVCAYFLAREQVRELVSPKAKDSRWTLHTDLGPIELLERPDEDTRTRIKAWVAQGADRQGQDGSPRWTLAVVLLHFRQRLSFIEPDSMIQCLCESFSTPEDLRHVHAILRDAFPHGAFFKFLKAVQERGSDRAKELAKVALREERAASGRRMLQGIGMLLGGPLLAWASLHMGRAVGPILGEWSGYLFVLPLLGGALVLPTWGTARFLGAAVSRARSRRLL